MTRNSGRTILSALAVTATLAGQAALADPAAVVLNGSVNRGGAFDYTQGSYAIGFEFTVDAATTLTQLGMYDSSLAPGGYPQILQPAEVGLYDLSTKALLASTIVSNTSTPQGYFRYEPLKNAVALNTTDTYAVMAISAGNYYLVGSSVGGSGNAIVNSDVVYQSEIGSLNGALVALPDTFDPTQYQTTIDIFGSPGTPTTIGDFGANFQLQSSLGTGVDTYNTATSQLVINSLSIGGATYASVVVGIASIVTAPVGTAPGGAIDTYDVQKDTVTVQSVTTGAGKYFNVVGKVGKLYSIGSVDGADTYDGQHLTIPSVLAYGRTYSNVVITVASVVGVAGGMPQATQDVYDSGAGTLFIPAVTYVGKVYTNVTVKVGSIVSY